MKFLQSGVKTELAPFFRQRDAICSFPEEVGTYKCQLAVRRGTVLFRHMSYSSYDGMWNDDSPANVPRERLFTAGSTAEFTFIIASHCGQPDHVVLVNYSYHKTAELICSFEKIETSDVPE